MPRMSVQFDFTTVMDRQGKDALAVDVDAALRSGMLGVRDAQVRSGFSGLPMGVAEMNFPTLPAIQEAMAARSLYTGMRRESFTVPPPFPESPGARSFPVGG